MKVKALMLKVLLVSLLSIITYHTTKIFIVSSQNKEISTVDYKELRLLDKPEKCNDKFFEYYKDGKITVKERDHLFKMCEKEKYDIYIEENLPMENPSVRW